MSYIRGLQLAARGPNLAREGQTIGPRGSAKICWNTFKLDSEARNFNDDCTLKYFLYYQLCLIRNHGNVSALKRMLVGCEEI